MWLIRLSINRPVLIVMIEAFLIVMGLVGFYKIGVDLFPDIDPAVVTITTQYPGAGPTEVENLVSKPFEEEIAQVGGIERLVSTSRENVSQIVVEFKLGTDSLRAQMEVQDKVSRVLPLLPKDVEEPLIQRVDFADQPIFLLAFKNQELTNESQKKLSEAMLRHYAENTLKLKLQQVKGVGQIDVFGGQEREILVNLDRQKLFLWKTNPPEIVQAIRAANINIPSGEISEEPKRRSLRVVGEFAHPDEIAETIVKTLDGGRVLRVKDFGETIDTFKDRDSYSRLNGEPVVILEVRRQSDVDTVEVVDQLQKKLADIGNAIPSGTALSSVYDGSRRIRMSVADVIESLVIAGILAIVVVYLFLGSIQSTFITGIAMPTTIITSFFVLDYFDYTLNIMTLLGLTLSVGLILDDAIVIRENIWEKIEKGMPAKKASFEGACEVFNAVLATSLTVLAVFLPVTLIPGVVGQFFSAFAMTVCIAIVLSTFDALTVAPMLSAYLMGFGFKKSTSGPNLVLRQCQRFGRFFSGAYEKILYFSLDRPKTVLVSATVIFFSSFLLLKSIGFTFIQEPDNGEIDVVIETSPGTSILNTNFHARVIEEKLSKFPGIDFISARVGSELSEDNQATIYVQLIPYADRSLSTAEVKKEIRAHLSTYAKSNDLKLNVRSSGGGGGGRKPISLAIQGPNIEVLQRITNQAMAKIREDLPGIVDLESNLQGGRSEIKFRVIPERLAAFDLSTDQVGQSLRGMYEGLLAGQYRDQGEEYDIRVRLKPEDRMGMTTLAMATVTNQKGQAIPLGAVTEQLSGEAPTKIVRIDQTRAALLEADMAPGFPLGTAIEDIKKIVAPMLPALYTMEFQGQAKSLNDLAIGAAIAFSLGSLFIYMIMAALYESFILPFAILLTLPLAVVGALLALLIAGVNLDLYAIIGVILLMGLVTKNAILLVDYVEQLRGEGLDRISALKAAGKRRMRPIMMTTIAMIAGMLPVALGFGELNKIRAGMGLASIGGLLSSTLLSLIVIPCAYIYLDKLRIWSGKTVAKFMRA